MKGAIERLEVGPFAIRESQDGANTVIEIKGAAAEVLAGGEARGLDALQLLANQLLLRRDEEAAGRVVLDVEGGSIRARGISSGSPSARSSARSRAGARSRSIR